MAQIIGLIRQLVSLISQQEADLLLIWLCPQVITRGKSLLNQGQVARDVAFVQP